MSITVEIRYVSPRNTTEAYEFIIEQISVIEKLMASVKEWQGLMDQINTQQLCKAIAQISMLANDKNVKGFILQLEPTQIEEVICRIVKIYAKVVYSFHPSCSFCATLYLAILKIVELIPKDRLISCVNILDQDKNLKLKFKIQVGRKLIPIDYFILRKLKEMVN